MNADPRAAAALVRALHSPACYRHPVQPVRLIETHISYVLLTGEFAYKLKKPLDLGFLDFTTIEKRRRGCQEELRLNRRTAPQLYLAVVPITGTIEAPRVDSDGPLLEYAVKMRQFDPHALFDTLASEGLLDEKRIDALAVSIARFHGCIETAAADAPYGDFLRVAAPMRANFDDLEADSADEGRQRVGQLAAWTEHALARWRAFIEARHREGFVRECHGDLHLGNVALIEEQPVLFDCIEFNADLRWIDVMNDAAFAFMDLIEHALPQLAWRFLNAYVEHTGDYSGLSLRRVYAVYRALVRAKVARLRGGQPGNEAKRTHLLGVAEAIAAERSPWLLVTHGLSGSGKTTVAQHLLQDLGAIRIRSDVERKRMFGAKGDTALYGADATRRTYDRLAELASGLLRAGELVIVDAAFLRRADRNRFRQLAAQSGAGFRVVVCHAPVETLRARVVARQAEGKDASDAGLAVLQAQLSQVEPIAPDERDALEIDTAAELGAGVKLLTAALGG